MDILHIRIFILIVFSATLQAAAPSPELEERILVQLRCSDIVQVENTLIMIGDESIISPKIIQSLYKMLNDPRPDRRLSRDVIGKSPSKHAYGALSNITGFKPSQPSLLFEESKSELKTFLRIKYRDLLKDDQWIEAPDTQKRK
jgi:hypothetical protein